MSAGGAEVATPGVALLLGPADISDRGAFDEWRRVAAPGSTEVAGHGTTRIFELAAEQLLPHRAARSRSRFLALSELTSAAPPPPTAATSSDHGAHARAFSVFALVRETTVAPELPPGVVPPRREVVRGAPGIFLAFTRPTSADTDAAYNTWYDAHHLPETLHLQSFTRGRRFRRLTGVADAAALPAVPTPYLTVYDIEDVGAVPFARQSLPWLSSVSVDHLGTDAYDKDFTQAFVYEQLDRVI